MPYSTCPNCGARFHLSISGDPRDWYQEYAQDKQVGDEVELQCFECWKELKEYDVVKVISSSKGGNIKKDDIGTVVMILGEKDNRAYEVECVLPDGSTKWIDTFKRDEIKFELKKN